MINNFNNIYLFALKDQLKNQMASDTKAARKDSKKRLVQARFSYTPENSDELPLKVNDILEVIEETEEGWWKGILNGLEGMFPSNFVTQLDPFPEELNNQSMNELSPSKNTNELKLVIGQQPLNKAGEENSSLGNKPELNLNSKPAVAENEIDGNLQMKSANIAGEKKAASSRKKPNISSDSPAPQLPPKPIREQAKVMFPYTAQNEDELNLKEGEIITILSKEIVDKGWWKGELNNRIGVFPDNFVELIKVEEQKKPERPNKPSSAIASKANIRPNTWEKTHKESSPKQEKKVSKTPPLKPPPPDIQKKEEKPIPPTVSKKSQFPLPMKKPSRSSLESKPVAVATVKSPVKEAAPTNIEFTQETKKIFDKKINFPVKDEEKREKKEALPFESVESLAEKLVHLTATRAKPPNRRPPSHIFLREGEKENVQSLPRRLSEPLISEAKEETQPVKTYLSHSLEAKAKVPPSVLPKSDVKNIISISPKHDIKDSFLKIDPIVSKVANVSSRVVTKDTKGNGTFFVKAVDPVIIKTQNEPKTDVVESDPCLVQLQNSTVNKSEFNELQKEVKRLKDVLDIVQENYNKLKVELEEEKKLRINFQLELQQLKQLKNA